MFQLSLADVATEGFTNLVTHPKQKYWTRETPEGQAGGKLFVGLRQVPSQCGFGVFLDIEEGCR